MTTTRDSIQETISYRLGDTNGDLWTFDEIQEYIQEGYDNLVERTGCLWATDVLPDYAYAFNITAEFEKDYLIAGERFSGVAQFTAEFERDYTDNADGPANHSFHWEYNLGFVEHFYAQAVLDLPDDFGEMERSTWNTRRIEALRSRGLEQMESRYELNKGEVEGYTQDKDGLNRIRKWRVPSAPYVPYSSDSISVTFDHTADFEEDYATTLAQASKFTSPSDADFAASTDEGPANHNYLWEETQGYVPAGPSTEWGILVQITDVTTDTPTPGNTFGDFVQVPGEHQMGDPWGIIVAIYKEPNNMRMEYRKRAWVLDDNHDFEIPDRYTIYVRHYALAKAYGREGDGQDLELAAHFMGRYEVGIQRMLKRKQAMQFQKKRVIGGGRTPPGRKPLVQLPWQYGTVVK